ncbi:MAG TPA: methyltransferase domain-containing protein [Rhizomicrobium sp.]|jgi:protein-L-isoaspartate(D-aspartate) O-methyltransferase|nr:methyltransferase domain-containing protein [Rhizomicrobium sp.]
MTLDLHKKFYAELVTAKGGVRNEVITAAFAATDRAKFVGSGPWKVFTAAGYIETPGDDPAFLYQDIPVALCARRTINNGEPSLHTRCIGALKPLTGENVLHVGAGTGYYTAILANLVGPTGSVVAFEIEADLAARAAANLADLPQVEVCGRSAMETKLPASDVIYVNAGATYPPAEWLDALKPGGRLLFPLTANHGAGLMLMITRSPEERYAVNIVSGAAFIPCIGARDEQGSTALMTALAKGGHASVRSLVRSNQPDETAWLSGNAWWFSTRGVT